MKKSKEMPNERHFFFYMLYNQNVNEIRFQSDSLLLLQFPVTLAIMSLFSISLCA